MSPNPCSSSPWFQARFSRGSAAFLCVSLWGCWAIYNATRAGRPGGNFVGKQALWLVLGGSAMLLVGAVHERLYRRATPVLALLAYLPLVLVLVLGIRINGMRGWFAWNGYFLQPSELAKPVYILSLAWILQRTEPYRQSWIRGFLPLLAFLGIWCIPIALQPDYGSLMVYTMTFALMAWAFGCATLHLLLTAGLGALAAAVVLVRHPYVLARIQAFIDPASHAQDAGWHILQFRRTLAAGGLFGRAWEHGLWSKAYLPLGYSDSIFASTAEKLGFFGVLPLIVLILALIIYGHHHACQTRDRYRSAVIFGITAMLVTQALVHLSVNLGLMPPTGITLPLVSYGGSSLISSMIAFGLVESMIHSSTPASDPASSTSPAVQQTPRTASPTPCPTGD